MGFLALGSDPWWTLTIGTTAQVITINVSPFYAQLQGTNLPATIPAATTIGSLTRLLLLNTSVLLALSSFQPKAWWKKTTTYLSLTTITELYLSLFLLINATRQTVISTYGTDTPITGSQTLQGNFLGLDLTYYQNPLATAAFALPLLLSLISLTIIGGGQLYHAIRNPEEILLISSLTQGVREVHLTPPYNNVWLSFADQDLNPLLRNPDRMSDDQLAMSFGRLNKALQPGGIVSVIIPSWASALGDRLLKLVPWTGLQLEKSEIIYRTPGRPENELVFRKPIVEPKQEPTLQLEILYPPGESPKELEQPVPPPPVTDVEAEPIWTQPMTKLERTMLKNATSIIARQREPVAYRELLNQVYMELLDRKIEFETARQIETTLLKHAGQELAIIEEPDETETKVVKKWWLGDKGIEQEHDGASNLWKRFTSKAKPTFTQLLHKWPHREKARYRPRKPKDED